MLITVPITGLVISFALHNPWVWLLVPAWAVAYLFTFYYTLRVSLWHKKDGADKADVKTSENV